MNMKTTVVVMAGVLIVMVILKCLGLFTFRSGSRLGFVGSDGIHRFYGRYTRISGINIHTLSPSKDSNTVHCEITTNSGVLHVLITQKSDDTVVLDKDVSGDETFDVTAQGKVKVELSTEGHSGSYRFEY